MATIPIRSAFTLFLATLVPLVEPATMCTDPPCAASLDNKIGVTTIDDSNTYGAGASVYGPFESDFGSLQELTTLCGSSSISDSFLSAGVDVYTAEQMIAAKCNVELPRQEGGQWLGMLDECGHQANQGFHENMKCLYKNATTGHSPSIANVDAFTNGVQQKLYGKWEDYNEATQTYVLPALDACNGHFGVTPDSGNEMVYHYHTTDLPPFTVGCFGPAKSADNQDILVSPTQCRSLYSDTNGCGGGDAVSVTTPTGTRSYDPWCPCWSGLSNFDGEAPPPVVDTSPPLSPPPSPSPGPSPVTHTIHLYKGFTWVSSPLFSGTLQTVFGDLSGIAVDDDLVKNPLSFSQYISGYGWFGNLEHLAPVNGLKVRTANGGDFTVTGIPEDQTGKTMTLHAGWNWVGWPSLANSTLDAFTNALSNPSGLNSGEERIKSQFDFTSYVPGYGWFGDLEQFEPGKGYIIRLSQANTLVSFGASTRVVATRAAGRKLDSSPPQRKLGTARFEAHPLHTGSGQWQLAPTNFEFSMCFVAVAISDGVISEDGDLAAFVNGELRGVARPSKHKMPVGSYKGSRAYNLMVYGQGETQGATVTFQFRHADGRISMIQSTQVFEKDGFRGTVMEPLVIALTASTAPTASTSTSAPSQSASPTETPSDTLPAPAGISLSTGAIVGIVIGALVVLVLAIALCALGMSSFRANQKGTSTTEVVPAQKVDIDVVSSAA